jgi:hypothetical protein
VAYNDEILKVTMDGTPVTLYHSDNVELVVCDINQAKETT